LFSSNQAKEKDAGRLLGGGLPALLTSDEFFAKVVHCDELQENRDRLKEAWKEASVGLKAAMEL
jgi:hypothetical protein